MPRSRSLLKAFVVATALALPAAGGAAAQCPLPEKESREAVKAGRVDRLPTVVKRAGLSMRDVVSAELCSSGGGFVYQVKILAPDGGLREIQIPAG